MVYKYKKVLLAITAGTFLVFTPLQASADNSSKGNSLFIDILLYLPNRLFDLTDIFRARVKVGPGFGAGLQLTEYGQFFLGSYISVWGGIPGPRQSACFPIPAGLESRSGAALSLLDATLDGPIGPDYSPTEIGANIYLGIVGADLTFDPVELLDFLAGFLFIDIREDDM